MSIKTNNQKLILIVDDDPAIRDALEDSLTVHNYNTLVANGYN